MKSFVEIDKGQYENISFIKSIQFEDCDNSWYIVFSNKESFKIKEEYALRIIKLLNVEKESNIKTFKNYLMHFSFASSILFFIYALVITIIENETLYNPAFYLCIVFITLLSITWKQLTKDILN